MKVDKNIEIKILHDGIKIIMPEGSAMLTATVLKQIVTYDNKHKKLCLEANNKIFKMFLKELI